MCKIKKFIALILSLLMILSMAPITMAEGLPELPIPEQELVEEPPASESAEPPTESEASPEEVAEPISNEGAEQPTEPSEEKAVYTLTVLFQYENGDSAASPYMAEYDDGSAYSVPIEQKPGYKTTLDASDSPITAVEGSINGADITLTVLYRGDSLNYTVRHHVEELKSDSSTETQMTEHDEIKTGRVGDFTEALPLSEYSNGHSVEAPINVNLAGEGVVIDIYYSLNDCSLSFNTAGGSYIPKVFGKYGQSVDISEAKPTRTGYEFEAWYLDPDYSSKAPGTVKLVEDTVLYAKWKGKQVSYTVIYWEESLESGKYDYFTSENAKALTGDKLSARDTKQIAYFHYNSEKSDKAVTVKGDGTTILNVYYDRNIYTISFNLMDSSASINIGGAVTKEYKFDAKLGQDISTLWPVGDNITGNKKSFFGWYSNKDYRGTCFVSKRFNLTADMIVNNKDKGETVYYAKYQDGRAVELHYWLENAEDNGYTDSALYRQSAVTKGNFEPKEIEGFTFSKSNSKNRYKYTEYNFYYRRNIYKLEFMNGGKIDKSIDEIKFDSSISDKDYIPERPSNLPDYFTFGGWYKTSDCLENSKFSFTGAKMPYSNLVLYAKWSAPDFTLSFESNGGTAVESIVVNGGTAANEPQEPTKADELGSYKFISWYEDSALTKPYDFAKPLIKDTKLYAGWKLITLTGYTVKYLFEDGTEASPQSGPYTAEINSVVYASARAVEGYIADAPSKNKKLLVKPEDNVIIFTYSKPQNIAYTVNYIIEGEEKPFKTEEKTTSLSRIKIVNTFSLRGYYALRSFAWLSLQKDVSLNNVSFIYRPVAYTVTYDFATPDIVDKVFDGLKIDSSTPTVAEPQRLGYSFMGWNPEVAEKVTGNALYLAKWQKNSYTVHYEYEGKVPDNAPKLPVDKDYLFEAEVQVAPNPEIPGYSFSSWNSENFIMPSHDVTIKGSFEANEDTGYSVEYYLENLTDDKFTLNSSEQLNGATDSPVKAEVKSFEGFTVDYSNKESQPEGTISGDGKTVLKLFYLRNRYTVTYNLNGGSQSGGNYGDVVFSGLKYGSSTPLTESPVREGVSTKDETKTWHFLSWEPKVSDTVTKDAVYRAQYSIEIIPLESPSPSPSPTVKPTAEPTTKPTTKPIIAKTNTPKTGDSTIPGFAIPICTLSGLALCALAVISAVKKKRKTEI